MWFLIGLGIGLIVAVVATRWGYRFGKIDGRREELAASNAKLREVVLGCDESHRDDSRDSAHRRTKSESEGPTT